MQSYFGWRVAPGKDEKTMLHVYSEEQNNWIKEQYGVALELCKDESNTRTKAGQMVHAEFIVRWPDMSDVKESAFLQKCRKLVPSPVGPRKGKKEVELLGFRGDNSFNFVILYQPQNSEGWRPFMVETEEQLKNKINELNDEAQGKPSISVFKRMSLKIKLDIELTM